LFETIWNERSVLSSSVVNLLNFRTTFSGAVHGQFPQLSGDSAGLSDAQPGFGS
jgi:hypothetical protein